MFDDIRSDDGRKVDGHKRERGVRPEAERPLADREVPLARPDTARVLSPTIHAWLDGELPEAVVRRGDTQREVTEARRHLATPTHVQQRIMDALPNTVPQLITPWWRREFVITPAAALGAAGALIALTAAVTALLLVIVHR